MANPKSPNGDAVDKTSAAKPSQPQQNSNDVVRELIESIAFAFVLALLFRAFVAEAFVIPTGSMAPTLYGRNKDVVCPGCGHCYAIGASEEIDDSTGRLLDLLRIEQSMCPNCRHLHNVKDTLVFKGDRILVNKSSYLFGEPDRWDVIVFRYPEDTQKNYIKRLVGLPGETIRVERGDVYARKGAAGDFKILRKRDPNKQKLLQHVVYDDEHPPAALLKAGWPENWRPETQGCKQDAQLRRFELASTDVPQSIRYSHFVPDVTDWDDADKGKPVSATPQPELVSDFCGYNACRGYRSGIDEDQFWVGDLTLSGHIKIASVSGANSHLTLELREGVRRYRCRIDVSSGAATLTRNDDLAADPETAPEIELGKANTPIKGAGSYSVRFANVDDRLCLWVNEHLLNNGLVASVEYDAPANHRPQETDLAPAAITVQGMTATVSKLLIERDIYYRADRVADDAGRSDEAYHEADGNHRLRELLSDPQKWGEMYEKISRRGGAEFHELASDEFFVMGDNSPRSADSRLWPNQVRHARNRHAVNRTALIGKAFFIYWPHGIPFLNGGKGFMVMSHTGQNEQEASAYPEYSFPFYPQWWRWKRIR